MRRSISPAKDAADRIRAKATRPKPAAPTSPRAGRKGAGEAIGSVLSTCAVADRPAGAGPQGRQIDKRSKPMPIARDAALAPRLSLDPASTLFQLGASSQRGFAFRHKRRPEGGAGGASAPRDGRALYHHRDILPQRGRYRSSYEDRRRRHRRFQKAHSATCASDGPDDLPELARRPATRGKRMNSKDV